MESPSAHHAIKSDQSERPELRLELCPEGQILYDCMSELFYNIGSFQQFELCLKQKLKAKDIWSDRKFTVFLETVEEVLEARDQAAKTAKDEQAGEQRGIASAGPDSVVAGDSEDPAGVCQYLEPEQIKIVKSLSEDHTSKLMLKKKRASQLVHTYVHLISEQNKTSAQMLAALKSTESARFTPIVDYNGGCNTKQLVVIFDLKMAGESATCPRLRVPPYLADQMKEYIHIALSLHADDSGLRLLPGVTHLHFLGFKNIASQIRNAYIDESQADRHLQKIKSHCRDMSILWEEDSLLERRASIQGQIEQKEILLQITSTLLEVGVALPKVSRQPFPGSNLGDALGYASFHKWGESLQITFKDKRKALGSRRVEVGGKSPELQQRRDLDMEPLAFHEMSETVYEVLFRELKGFATIDFTPGGGVLAFLHIKMKRHYAAVTWSESHRQALYEHLIEKTFRAMLDPESPCADAGLITLAC